MHMMLSETALPSQLDMLERFKELQEFGAGSQEESS